MARAPGGASPTWPDRTMMRMKRLMWRSAHSLT